MNEREAEFVEAMASFFGAFGFTPMAGRMWAWLLICEPAEQTAADLAAALQASRGAISGTARILTSVGMIRRTRRRGDRREWFSAPPEAFESLLANAGRVYADLRRITERGLEAMADRPPEQQVRLQHVRDAVGVVERELPMALQRFLRERDAGGRNETGQNRQ